jgi:putative glutamine amidotransferase
MLRVGVTSSSPAAAKEYVSALAGAGADPLVLRNDVASLDQQIEGCSGILVTGGWDIDPSLYGAPLEPVTETGDPRRDAFELGVMRAARQRGMPLLAICRGLQVANVAFGGTLIQDIPTHVDTALAHAVFEDGEMVRGVFSEHVVRVESGCLLASIVGTNSFATGSRHHQAVGVLAPDLRAVAATPDGIIEALEAGFASPFWLAVQWHPESTLDDGGPSSAIFARFVAACSS